MALGTVPVCKEVGIVKGTFQISNPDKEVVFFANTRAYQAGRVGVVMWMVAKETSLS